MKKTIFTLMLRLTIVITSFQKEEVNETDPITLAQTKQDNKISKETLDKIAALILTPMRLRFLKEQFLMEKKKSLI